MFGYTGAKKQKGADEMLDMNGAIMSGDSPVAKIEAGRVIPLCKERMPIYLTRGGDLEVWLTSRAIDRHRPNSRILKKMLRLTDTSDLATVLRVHAATITDNYWLRQENEPDLTWEQVRFAESTFAELALIGGVDSINRHYTPEELTAPTPELTNTGSFEKCWKLEDGTWYMYKQGKVVERFSELFTSRLCVALGLHAAEYTEADGSVKTRDFTESCYNFEPAADLVGENEDYVYNYDKLEGLKPGLGREYLDILYMDALCFNVDRHTNNYGILRDRKSGELVGMAPNFDNNMALISRGYLVVENVRAPQKTSGVFIRDFLELLKERGISYTPPKLDGALVRELAATTLPDEEIDRNYVVEFILNRQHRLETGIQELTQSPGMHQTME